MIKHLKANCKPSKPTWWTLAIGDNAYYKGLLGYVTYIGRNNGENTVVHIQLPNIAKARRVRIKELS